MGICYDKNTFTTLLAGDWEVEAREKSIIIQLAEDQRIEVDYPDLDGLQRAVAFAQEVRRDKDVPVLPPPPDRGGR